MSRALNSCTVLRTFTRRYYKSLAAAEAGAASKVEIVTERCAAPLFSGNYRITGVCRQCASGWEGEQNKFANEAERARAMRGDKK